MVKIHLIGEQIQNISQSADIITATTATCIDNILTNNEDIIQSTILISDITDHFPTILSSNLDVVKQKICEKEFVYKRHHSDDNIDKFKQRLSDVKWQVQATFQATFQIWIVLKHDPDLEQMFQIRLLIQIFAPG